MQSSSIANVSVRQMVEFILRSGSIDAGYLSANRALDGTRTHQRIQRDKKKEAKKTNSQYHSEVTLRISCEHKGIVFNIDGRADGIWIKEGAITVEEIKSTLLPSDKLVKDINHWHWAQAKCYGYMYSQMMNLSRDDYGCFGNGDGERDIYTNEPIDDKGTKPGIQSVFISVIYAHVETEDVTVFTENFALEHLAAFFHELLDRYWEFASMDIERLEARNETARVLPFPYEGYRLGQRELAVSVFAAVKQKKKLFAQAPTGIGKTMSTLYPAVKSLAEGFGKKIFYVTAKVVARQVAEDAFRRMLGAGLIMRAVTLTAKDKVCFCETRICDREHCVYANGHFDRVNDAILDCVRRERVIDRPVVTAYAQKYTVCPAELQLDIATFADAVVCDYNHVYDPKARIRRFFDLGGDFIILNDEAHNLVDRAREMFSSGLYKGELTALRKEIGRKHPLYKPLGRISAAIKQQLLNPQAAEGDNPAKREPFSSRDKPNDLLPPLLEFASLADAWLALSQQKQAMIPEPLLNAYFAALDFLRVADLFDERYVTYHEPRNGFVKLFCVDPSFLLAQEQKKSRASVFFSATLTPLPYFRAVLGGEFNDYTLRLGSPFPRENLCLLVDERISTKYKDRADSLEAVAGRMHAMAMGKPGNYIAFFPSYQYLTDVLAVFGDKYPGVRTLAQTQDLDDQGKEDFLACFNADNDYTLLAFAVMGGVFSEGIDLVGDRLIGAAIVGVGLPLISEERNVISNYYNQYDNSGFAFAYQYPGMNKVMQAAGRVIRSETDKGVILLIDARFTERTYRTLFPLEWEGFIRIGGKTADEIIGLLRAFWDKG